MLHQRCTPQAYRVLAIIVAFLVLLLIASFWKRGDLVPFFMARPSINLLIFALGIIGLVLCLVDLFRVLAQARALDGLSSALANREPDSLDTVRTVVNSAPRGLVRNRGARAIEIIRHNRDNTAESLGLLSDADAQFEDNRGLMVRYILGVMVFLGLIGTFWGVLTTVRGVQDVLQALDPSRVEDPMAFIASLKSSIGDMLGGLSTAFSTSLFGLGGSVILGFVEVQTRQARTGLLAELDRFTVTDLLPRIPRTGGAVIEAEPLPAHAGVRGDEVYLVATQQALGENLRQLTEVISLQTSTDEKITNSLVEIRGMLEALREEEQGNREAEHLANQMRQGLLERIDNMSRHMERIVKETRLTRESSEQATKTVLDRMKLEGEITNRTLSIGFSDMTRVLGIGREIAEKRDEPKKG
jgi:hypothetical protein